ncbi:MAG: 3-deoxy-D-manno-octulosonic-acid transferase [Candidatus Binatia bacterium]
MNREIQPAWARVIYATAGAAASAWTVASGFAGDHETKLRARERMGRWWPTANSAPSSGSWIWIHAASVGEVTLANRVGRELAALGGDFRLLLSCNTATGKAVASHEVFEEVHYFPIDWKPVLNRILGLTRPRLLLVVETEIWPTLLAEAQLAGVPVAFANARISDRSWPRYQRLVDLIGPLLGSVAAVSARDAASASRLRRLGAPQSAVHVNGDIKFDAISIGDVTATTPAIATETPTVLAASTHDGEESVALDAFAIERKARPELRLVLAPRHPQRATAVVDEVARRGWNVATWTLTAGKGDWDVLVVDTIGELLRFFRAVDAVFLGGSLVPVGGHNLLEPAAYGHAPICGPHLDGIADQVAVLEAADALVVVGNARELATAWHLALDEPVRAQAAGKRAQDALASHAGALVRTINCIAPLLTEDSA